MNRNVFKLALLGFFCLVNTIAKAQSATAYTSNFIGAGGASEVSDSLYLGPGLFELDGDWEIFSQFIIIDPNATFTGPGTLRIFNPSAFVGTSASTKIDANNNINAIGVNIDLQNDEGIELTNLNFPSDFLIIAGWTETTSSTFFAGENINFGIDGAHLFLDDVTTGDLRLDASATLSGFSPNRYVVTNNSLLSHVVKENYTSAFIFPVGIATGDYTPAQVSNASNNTIHVSVQDYVASASPEVLTDGTITTADGMNRTWHIFADAASISSNINLQHNSSTNQTGFSDATHFVTQWGTTTPNTTGDNTIAYSMSSWQSNVQGPGALGNLSSTGTIAGSSMRNRTYSSGLATLSSANESFFTKSADSEHPLPVKLVSFEATPNNCAVKLSWIVGSQNEAVKYNLMHSTDGKQYTLLGSIEPNANAEKYDFDHSDAGEGTHFYRLHILEKNNKTTYSPSELATVNCAKDFDKLTNYDVSIYPNPVANILFIKGLTSGQLHKISISTVDGKILQEQSTTESNVQIDMQELLPSTYILQVYDKDLQLLSVKILKL